MATPILTNCTECGTPLELVKKTQRDYYHEVGRAYCSPACSKRAKGRSSSRHMAETNRRGLAAASSLRMSRHNPMHDPATPRKVSDALRAMGHQPAVKGGNGRGPSPAERLLADALGWPTNVVVPTRMPRASGYPTAYKLDVANEALRIAIEVDGASHSSLARQGQDRKKERFLAGRGWIVLRFSNRDVMAQTGECARTVWSLTSRLQGSTPT
jgi:hypothetical protein